MRRRALQLKTSALDVFIFGFPVIIVLTSIFIAVGATTSSLRGWQAIVMLLVLFGPLLIDACAWQWSVKLNGTIDDRMAVASSAAWTVFTVVAILVAQQVELNRLEDVLGAFLLTGRFAFTTASLRAWVTSWRDPVARDDAEARAVQRQLAKEIRRGNRAVYQRELRGPESA